MPGSDVVIDGRTGSRCVFSATKITDIVTNALSQVRAQEQIVAAATRMQEADRAKFNEVVETELLSLHDGNFARYKIRPSEFATWKTVWEGKKI